MTRLERAFRPALKKVLSNAELGGALKAMRSELRKALDDRVKLSVELSKVQENASEKVTDNANGPRSYAKAAAQTFGLLISAGDKSINAEQTKKNALR